MAAVDDLADPELGTGRQSRAACVEPLPAGVMIDNASGLTEPDLAPILRHLHATRLVECAGTPDALEARRSASSPSVPFPPRD